MKIIGSKRQGDMWFVKISENDIDDKLKRVSGKQVTVGLGEVTGHKHTVKTLETSDEIVTYVENENMTEDEIAMMDNLIFEVMNDEGAVVIHEEHDPILLEKGLWRRINQVEYNPISEELVKVRD